MQLIQAAEISIDSGLEGDCKGLRFPTRQITILAREDWDEALADLPQASFAFGAALPWTARRANLLVEAVDLPHARRARLRVGEVELEVTGQTYPCRRMEEAAPGLLKALAANWRGGLTCRVIAGGRIRIGDHVAILTRPTEHAPKLPG